MKFIKIPDPVALVDLFDEPVTKEEDGQQRIVSFREFVLGRLQDVVFTQDMESILAAVDVKRAVSDANGVVALETAHWQKLKQATERPSPQSAYHPGLAFNLVPFMKAVIDARDAEPDSRD